MTGGPKLIYACHNFYKTIYAPPFPLPLCSVSSARSRVAATKCTCELSLQWQQNIHNQEVNSAETQLYIRFAVCPVWRRIECNYSSWTTQEILEKTPVLLDLPQVDHLANGASLFWPRSDRPRATKSKDFFENLRFCLNLNIFRQRSRICEVKMGVGQELRNVRGQMKRFKAAFHKPLSIFLCEIPSFILTQKFPHRKMGEILYFPGLSNVR